MRTLAFDGRMGASGDMILGALLAAGADRDVLAVVEQALPVRYAIDETMKNGIAAVTVDVLLTEGDASSEADDGSDDPPDYEDAHDHSDHTHSNDHGDSHDHNHDHEHAEGSGPLRSYPEVVEIVSEMGLDSGVEASALDIFEILGEAEAAVHGTDLDETHFHEVGADDAIADVVGAALLFADLAPDRVLSTPLAIGGGEVRMSHGRYPVPTPAVVEIASEADWSLRGGPVERELLTPTGAAILAHYAAGIEALPPISLSASGYGAGGYDLPERPNVLRGLLGDARGELRREDIRVLETTLDDATPEILGGLQDSLRAVGARNVAVLPATTKKSRPGHVVQVIVKPEDRDRVARRLAEETGTLGVREGSANHRWVADREIRSVVLGIEGSEHPIDVKVASDTEGTVYDVSAEYDDAAAIARETALPIREVMRRAESKGESR
ncbi:nickel pincer cofactor biosynthesis protein LarC [Halobacteriales archaeon QS_3_64_16]|nr:MAG: nickel pincer cofactor biosynthesis protein LarC [Halobacteriales archaeon QS_3_64_16]